MPIPQESRPFLAQPVEYAQQKNLRKGKALHGRIIKIGPSSCVYIANSLVNLYAKCGYLPKANLVFETIHDKDVVSWNCLIDGYTQQGPSWSSLVMELFQRMRTENTLPNAHTFSGVFNAASNMADVSGGQQAHTLAIKTASFDDVFVGSSLLNMYRKKGRVAEARKLFDRMPERNSVSWATMISGYALQRLARETLSLFEVMRQGQECDNEFVFTSVLSALTLPEYVNEGKQIHGVAIKNGLASFIAVGNSLVTMYSKCGSSDDALQTFKLSDDKSPITWSAMVTGFAQSGDFLKALKLFSSMHLSGIIPSEFTFVGVINACSDIGAVEEGKQMHGYSLKLGFESQIYIITALVDMYAKCGNTLDARKEFDYVQEPDIVLWTSMIGGYVQNGENEEALGMYCRMQTAGVMPNELTMASVLKACSCLAALEQGKQIHARSIKFGFGLEVPVGSALSTMYAKCGSLDDGNLVFRRMPARDVVSWNAMIAGYVHNHMFDLSLRIFSEMLVDGKCRPDQSSLTWGLLNMGNGLIHILRETILTCLFLWVML